MSTALILACFWVLAATGVAVLPMRRQRGPAIALLLAAPAILGWISIEHGGLIASACALGALSVMRHPARAILRRLRPARSKA